MSGFYGQYEKSLDAKGRLVIPNEFRARLPENETLVMTKWSDQTVALFPESLWKKLGDNLHLHVMDHKKRRAFFGSGFPVSMDGQGRISLPPKLATFAMLGKDLVLVGDWDKIIIWDKPYFDRMERQEDAEINTAFSDAFEIAYQKTIEAEMPSAAHSSTTVATGQAQPAAEGGEA